jgi:hypothetical protein
LTPDRLQNNNPAFHCDAISATMTLAFYFLELTKITESEHTLSYLWKECSQFLSWRNTKPPFVKMFCKSQAFILCPTRPAYTLSYHSWRSHYLSWKFLWWYLDWSDDGMSFLHHIRKVHILVNFFQAWNYLFIYVFIYPRKLSVAPTAWRCMRGD